MTTSADTPAAAGRARGRQLPQTRVTRDDWIHAAVDALKAEGVAGVKIARLAELLDVRRSSFYWYFEGRPDLDAAVLDIWQARNIAPIVERAGLPAPTVTAAVLNLFRCWADPSLFDRSLELAVRDWARHDATVRQRLERGDADRIAAIAALHARYEDDELTAQVRARIQFHSQMGLYALGVDEPDDERLRLLPAYVAVFTGRDASAREIAAFTTWVRERAQP